MFLTKINLGGDTVWSKNYSSGYNNVANSVEAGREISVAGYTRFSNGTAKSVLLRYTPEGILMYSKIFGESTDEDVPWGVATAGQFTYVAGQTCPYPGHPPNASLCKLSPDGKVIWWSWNWGEIQDRAMSVAVSYDDVYIVGETYKSEIDSQVFVKKYVSPNFGLSPEVSLSLKLSPFVIGCLLLIIYVYEIINTRRARLQAKNLETIASS